MRKPDEEKRWWFGRYLDWLEQTFGRLAVIAYLVSLFVGTGIALFAVALVIRALSPQ